MSSGYPPLQRTQGWGTLSRGRAGRKIRVGHPATSIAVPVPSGATTGNVVVTVGGQASNGVSFTVTLPAPSISGISPNPAPVGMAVYITGSNFGATQGTVTFGSTNASSIQHWDPANITVVVPAGAGSSVVVTTSGGQASNGMSFTVGPAVQNLVTSTSYNLSTYISSVTFGTGDSDTFYMDPNTGRQQKYVFSVNGATDTGVTTWNPNSSLASLQITDNVPGTSDTQTCNYTHDDLARIASVNCANGGTNQWNQNFAYDSFGNITKTVPGGGTGISFTPGYSSSTNWITSLPGCTPTTDANGRVTYDCVHNYAWDAENRMIAVDSTTTITYDALGRMVEKAVSGTHTQIAYGPQGKFALMNGQTLVKAFVPLPSATAVYTSTGLAYYRHTDHLGSSRLATTPSRTLYSSTAHAPFGEPYAQAGTTDLSFTGQEQDTVSGMHDFLLRKYVPVQGRWTSPDPAGLGAVDPTNPQTWNRYAYVLNNPMSAIDLLGEATCYMPDGTASQCDDPSMFAGSPFLNGTSLNPYPNPDPFPASYSCTAGNCNYVLISQNVNPVMQGNGQGGGNNGQPAKPSPPKPAPPKSPARQQCEANAANKYQNTFNAVDNGFYKKAGKSALKGGVWGGGVGCVMTIEIGCAEGGLPGYAIGFLSGGAKSMWEDLGSVGMAYLQYRDDMNACKAIP